MAITYNRAAGQSVERLAALSDGIFAVAMTLLATQLRHRLRRCSLAPEPQPAGSGPALA